MKAFIGVRKFDSELIQNSLGSYMYLTQALVVDFDLDCQNCLAGSLFFNYFLSAR